MTRHAPGGPEIENEHMSLCFGKWVRFAVESEEFEIGGGFPDEGE